MRLTDYPILLFVFTIAVLWIAGFAGAALHRPGRFDEKARDDYNAILGATLTLLALLIGFSFSLATNRFDQRKNHEEAEANAIGTEWVRLELLRAGETVAGQRLLRSYLGRRIAWYETTGDAGLAENVAATSRLQNELWAVVRGAAQARPTPVTALAASGMNDVLNSQGYTQAAWLYRIPGEAWALMFAIAICANILIGFGAHVPIWRHPLFLVLPVIIGIAFLLIADIDSPRGGLIAVSPQNLISVAQSLGLR